MTSPLGDWGAVETVLLMRFGAHTPNGTLGEKYRPYGGTRRERARLHIGRAPWTMSEIPDSASSLPDVAAALAV